MDVNSLVGWAHNITRFAKAFSVGSGGVNGAAPSVGFRVQALLNFRVLGFLAYYFEVQLKIEAIGICCLEGFRVHRV